MTLPATFHWSQTVPWVLVILGWLLINRQNNAREDRKEVRARVDSVKLMVDKLEESAIEHHTVSQDLLRCMKLKRSLTRLGKEFALLQISGLEVSSESRRITSLRQAITLRNFDSSRYSVLAPSDPIVSSVGTAADDLRHAVDVAFAKKYKPGGFMDRTP